MNFAVIEDCWEFFGNCIMTEGLRVQGKASFQKNLNLGFGGGGGGWVRACTCLTRKVFPAINYIWIIDEYFQFKSMLKKKSYTFIYRSGYQFIITCMLMEG